MSQDGIISLFKPPVLSSGVYGICYDFTQSGYATPGCASSPCPDTRILSREPANTSTSGEVVGDPESFTGNPGSGYFELGHIEINPPEGVFSGSSTFLFSVRKTSTAPLTIFNNFVQAGPSTDLTGSGCEIGLNSCGVPYVKTIEANINQGILEPTYRTANPVNVAQQNFWSVRFDDRNLSIGLFNPRISGFEFKNSTFALNPNFVDNPSDANWVIGSGEYTGVPFYMDFFSYIKGGVPLSFLDQIAQASYQEYSRTDDISGVVTGQITGYVVTTGNSTGITFRKVFSGYTGWSECFSSSSGDPQTALASTLVSGVSTIYTVPSGILLPYVSGFYTGSHGPGRPVSGVLQEPPRRLWEIETYDETQTGPVITGFSGSGQTVCVDFSGAVYVLSGVTGNIYESYSGSGVTGASTYYLATGGSSGISGAPPDKYNFSTLTYLRESGSGNDIGDYIIGPGAKNNINRSVGIGRSTFALPSSNIFVLDRENYSLTGAIFAANGVTRYGGYPSGTINNLGQTSIVITGGDYYITGQALISQQVVGLSWHGIFDAEQARGRVRKIIADSGESWDASDVKIVAPSSTTRRQFFWNGQKIYSGIDYEDVGDGNFTPLGTQLTGMTGALIGYENYTGATEITGLNKFSIYNQDFRRDNWVYFVNGIRQPLDALVQYATGTCLLTGREVMRKSSAVIYNQVIRE